MKKNRRSTTAPAPSVTETVTEGTPLPFMDRNAAVAHWKADVIRDLVDINRGLRETYEREVLDWKANALVYQAEKKTLPPVPVLVVHTFHENRFNAYVEGDQSAYPYLTSEVTVPRTAEQILNPTGAVEPVNPIGAAYPNRDNLPCFRLVPGTRIEFGRSIPDPAGNTGYGYVMIEYRDTPFSGLAVWLRVPVRGVGAR
jgi:hypothetical protein